MVAMMSLWWTVVALAVVTVVMVMAVVVKSEEIAQERHEELVELVRSVGEVMHGQMVLSRDLLNVVEYNEYKLYVATVGPVVGTGRCLDVSYDSYKAYARFCKRTRKKDSGTNKQPTYEEYVRKKAELEKQEQPLGDSERPKKRMVGRRQQRKAARQSRDTGKRGGKQQRSRKHSGLGREMEKKPPFAKIDTTRQRRRRREIAAGTEEKTSEGFFNFNDLILYFPTRPRLPKKHQKAAAPQLKASSDNHPPHGSGGGGGTSSITTNSSIGPAKGVDEYYGALAMTKLVRSLVNIVDTFLDDEETYKTKEDPTNSQQQEDAEETPGGGEEGKRAESPPQPKRRVLFERLYSTLTARSGGGGGESGVDALRREVRADPRAKHLLMECKHLVHQQFWHNQLNYKICVHCFMNASSEKVTKEFTTVNHLYTLAKFQCEELDEALLDHLIDNFFNFKNAAKEPSGTKRGEDARVGVMGLGPTALFAIKELLQKRFPVVAYERFPRNHSEKRKRGTELDSAWVEQLRWFLGKKFDEATSGEWPKLRLQWPEGPDGQTCLETEFCHIEDLMRDRLDDLTKRLEYRFGIDSPWVKAMLDIQYGKTVEEVRPTEKGRIQLVVRDELDKAKLTKGQKTESKLIKQPLAGVILATGSKKADVGNRWIGVPQERSKPKNYYGVVVTKGRNLLSKENPWHLLHVKTENTASLTASHTYRELAPFFTKTEANINAVIADHATGAKQCKAVATLERFKHLGSIIIRGVRGEERGPHGNQILLPNTGANDYSDEKLVVKQVWDRGLHFEMIGEPPERLMEFQNSLDKEVNYNDLEEVKACKEMKACIMRLFFDSLLKYGVDLGKENRKTKVSVEDNESVTFLNINNRGEIKQKYDNPDGLYFEPDSMLNAMLYTFVQATPAAAAHYLFSSFFLALGDAAVSSHFELRTGLGICRAEVEDVLQLLDEKYPLPKENVKETADASDENNSTCAAVTEENWLEEFVEVANRRLHDWMEMVVDHARGPIEHYSAKDAEEKRQSVLRDAATFINRLYKSKRYVAGWKPLGHYDYSIDCLNNNTGGEHMVGAAVDKCVEAPDRLQFTIHVRGGRSAGAMVDDEGLITVMGPPPMGVVGSQNNEQQQQQQQTTARFYATDYAAAFLDDPEEYGGLFVPSPNPTTNLPAPIPIPVA